MLAPRNALVSNLNYVHLQHVSLGVHLSLRPELMENSITKDPGKGVTGHHHLWKDIADSVEVDANSNDPSIPCQCCDKHSEHMSPCLENSEDNLEANICEELPSPFDLPSSPLSASSPSSNSSSSSDFTLDESPASMYYKEFVEDGLETPDQQPDIIPLDAAMENSLSHETNNPTILPPPSTPEESKTHSTATTTSIEKGHATTLDANCNDVSGLQPSPSPPTSGCLSCDEDAIQRTETLDNTSKSTEIQEVTHSTWPFLEDDELLPGLVLHGHVNTQSPRKTITSFNELAQKRRRGSGVGPSQQTKKDKSDWLIVFSPDSENPPVNELTATAFYQGAHEQYNLSLAAGKEVTTFREMKYRSTLSKQSAQQAKFQTSGNMGPQKTACVENEFPHLSDREMWLEIPRTVENGSHHPNENGSHRQKEKEQRGEDMAGLPYHYAQEIRPLQSGTRREHMEAADGRVQDLWSASGYTVPMSNTGIRSPRGAYIQSTFNGSHPLAKKGEKWVRGKADGGDKKFREGSVFGPQAIPSHLLIQLPTNHRLIFPPVSLSPPSLAMPSATALLPCSPCAVLQTLPARMSPVGALSPPHRGFLHLLNTHDMSVLQSPLFPRIRTLTRVSPEREPACTPHLDTPSTGLGAF
uniref:RUN and SH3 domain containing 1 n=1 Tax=Leptobrachium leishanense TaxID=445787 RepID=A0A8C5PJH9_9ANUR